MDVDSYTYSLLSCKLTKDINRDEKRDNGIYFTPPKTIVKCLDILAQYNRAFNNILEPSCGSCEFIERIRNYHPSASITGVEYNKIIYDNIKNIYDGSDGSDGNNIKIYNDDFLKTSFTTKFDLIIGNPPYYVLKKNDVEKQYYKYFEGRPNMFILFIIKSLTLLTDDGILCFILPKSFLNCLYYNKTREYIYTKYDILTIQECEDNYIDTEQPTILFIIRKKADSGNSGDSGNEKYILQHLTDTRGTSSNSITSSNSVTYTIFSTSDTIARLNHLYSNATTLNTLNFKVYVGNIVWNQHKKILTDDSQKTLLIYSSYIKNNKIEIIKYANTDKKNYINKKGVSEPLLVINRGYGVGNYNFEYSLINCDDTTDYIREYLIENHLICIKYVGAVGTVGTEGEGEDGEVGEDIINKYKQLYESFNDERTAEFIKLYFGNNAINATELSNILPIYL
jgi:type I restriction-modification system DNA methylase subunit